MGARRALKNIDLSHQLDLFWLCSHNEAGAKAQHVERSLGVNGAMWSSASPFKEDDGIWKIDGRRVEFALLEILEMIVCWGKDTVRKVRSPLLHFVSRS
jgi:hypothetical protein